MTPRWSELLVFRHSGRVYVDRDDLADNQDKPAETHTGAWKEQQPEKIEKRLGATGTGPEMSGSHTRKKRKVIMSKEAPPNGNLKSVLRAVRSRTPFMMMMMMMLTLHSLI